MDFEKFQTFIMVLDLKKKMEVFRLKKSVQARRREALLGQKKDPGGSV